MASNSENKKQAKLRKKQQKAKRIEKRKKDKKTAFAAKHRYPKFVLRNPENASPEFVEAIRDATEMVDFEVSNFFSDWHRKMYQVFANDGLPSAMQKLATDINSEKFGNTSPDVVRASFVFAPGEAIYDAIPLSERAELLPFNDIRVIPMGNSFHIEFSKLESDIVGGQRLYFSRHRPTVSINGRKRVVAYTIHSIERVRERLNPRWMGYAAAGDVHAYFSHCKHFELCLLHPNQEAVTFYNRITQGFVNYLIYVNEILGRSNLDSKKANLYYRLGYCPLAIAGDYAVAKTFLYPGFTSTPEYGAILNSDLPRREKDRLIGICQNNNADEVMWEGNTEVIKWFHDNGVPQVIQSNEEFFEYD